MLRFMGLQGVGHDWATELKSNLESNTETYRDLKEVISENVGGKRGTERDGTEKVGAIRAMESH